MPTNKIDKHIADKLKNRELQPSSSSWERLSMQLDEQEPKKKKNWFLYIGYAASFTLLLFLGYQQFTKPNVIEPTKEIIVETTEDTIITEPKIDLIKEEVIVEKAIANVQKTGTPQRNTEKESFLEEKELPKSIKQDVFVPLENKVAIVDNKEKISEDKEQIEKQTPIKRTSNSNIRINADDLLYAVTHTEDEVNAYYAKHMINHKALLDTIEKELKMSKLKVNPETILAEVENEIYQGDDARESFMNKFKTKLSEVIVAFVDRNK